MTYCVNLVLNDIAADDITNYPSIPSSGESVLQASIKRIKSPSFVLTRF